MLFPSRRTGAGTSGESPSGTPAIDHGAARPVLFDGKTDRAVALEDQHLGRTSFTLDVQLISAGLPTEALPFTETTPPMPFRVGSTITCAAEPGGYSVSLRENGKDIARGRVSALYGSTRITIVSSPQGASIFGNGTRVAHIDKPVALDGAARVGLGFLKRYWAGEVEYFDIFDDARFLGESFDRSTGRLPATGRIATLEP